MTTYPLAKDGVFATVQGEGALLGLPTVFVRLAGCSVACKECDTDYRVHRRATAAEIGGEIQEIRKANRFEWIWLTGGEPADQPNLFPLLDILKCNGKVAIATSGAKHFGGVLSHFCDFLSVSPHGTPDQLLYPRAAQINLVPGLGGLKLSDWEAFDFSNYTHKWVTPLDAFATDNVAECRAFVDRHPGFRLGVQAHKRWSLL